VINTLISPFQAVILGIVQGITEWLPISSSGHLVILQESLGVEVPIFFDIALHVATLIVVLVFFRKEVLDILSALTRLDFKSPGGKLAVLIAAGSLPTALIGVTFKDTFKLFFHNLQYIGFALLATGILLYFSERHEAQKDLKLLHALVIGIAQGIAIIPGISRSGTTISTALLLGIEKEKAARFSFLLSIPAILGATAYDATSADFTRINLLSLSAGMITSSIVGYISLKTLLKIVVTQRFHYFAYYCLTLGAILILLK
jgi:undecaprenyl-diphosphatase